MAFLNVVLFGGNKSLDEQTCASERIKLGLVVVNFRCQLLPAMLYYTPPWVTLVI